MEPAYPRKIEKPSTNITPGRNRNPSEDFSRQKHVEPVFWVVLLITFIGSCCSLLTGYMCAHYIISFNILERETAVEIARGLPVLLVLLIFHGFVVWLGWKRVWRFLIVLWCLAFAGHMFMLFPYRYVMDYTDGSLVQSTGHTGG